MWRLLLSSILVFFMLASESLAQPLIAVKNEKQSLNIGRQIAILQDTAETLALKDILTPVYQERFAISGQDIPNFGSSTLPVWCRFRIKNYTLQKLVLTINNSELEWVDLYIKKENTVIHKKLSAYLPFSQREILINKYLFLLDIPKDSTQVYYLRVQTRTGLQFPMIVSTFESLLERQYGTNLLYGIYTGIMVIMLLYNLFIYFSTKDFSYLFYVLYVAFMTLTNLIEKGIAFQFLWPLAPNLNRYVNIAACLTGTFAVLFSISFLKLYKYAKTLERMGYGIIAAYFVTIAIILSERRFAGMILTEVISVVATLILLVAGIIAYRKKYKPAKYYLIAWTFLLLSVLVFVWKDYNYIIPYNSLTVNSMTIGAAIEAILLSLALANKINMYKEEKENAQLQALHSLEENRQLITEQNMVLERKVEERTAELKRTNQELTTTLQNLKDTQVQLVQREKMASLGELTAGIAHEIQNPLNFINNFSELSIELADELKEEVNHMPVASEKLQTMQTIVADLIQNQEKINLHGRRADAIVKGMLQHSRKSSGEKEPTDINALADEFLRLSYHGIRVKNKGFNASLVTHFDSHMGKVKVVPQELGRVLLNLFNNAFYAVEEKAKRSNGDYKPEVTVTTLANGDKVEIKVRDNGTGMSKDILDKIYQPFFTTKPPGEGTGLGLSLSYDIVTKSHKGEMRVSTQKGEYTEFTVVLPNTTG